ncbi:uncharacterized protein [Henckelia pumila]|uniref:uncharacterized protein n=1 Tax=Henckelia pumila TaxID=405737 RepID=UPI003C6E977E
MAEEEQPRQNVNRSMLECSQPSINGASPSIIRPAFRANQFEIKPAIIQMIQNSVQFGGTSIHDPNAHIANFLKICDTFKHRGVSDDAIRLRLFPFSLRDKAKAWLNSLSAGSITTWEDMAKAFLTKYFPPSKSMKLRTDIKTFSQSEQETLKYGNQNYRKQHQEEKSSLEKMMQKFISSSETRMQNQDASIKNLENQIGLLAKAMSSRDLGTLPSDTENNPKEQSSNSTPPPTSQSNFVIPPPFPTALKKAKLDAQFAKFLKIFKKLNIIIPFVDALMQMPSYSKFLKEILSNKRKLEEHALVILTESASINLMSYSVFRKLGLGEPKSTRMSLQLADRSIKHPRGIIKDVLVKLDKFIFSMDFVVLDMEEDLDMPLILGRLFLATEKALIDVQKGELLLRVGDDKIAFDIDVVDSLVYNFVQDTLQEPLEAALASHFHEEDINEGKKEMTAYLNENQPVRRGGRLYNNLVYFKILQCGNCKYHPD